MLRTIAAAARRFEESWAGDLIGAVSIVITCLVLLVLGGVLQ